MTRLAPVAALLLLAATASATDAVRYYRGLSTVREAIDRIEGRCRVRNHEVVLFVLEQADFHKRTERWAELGLSHEYDPWSREIAAWGRIDCP